MSTFSRKAMVAQPTGPSGPRLRATLVVAGFHAALIAALAVVFHARQLPRPTSDIAIPVVFAPAMPERADPPLQVLPARILETQVTPARLAALLPATLQPAAGGLLPRRAPAPSHREPRPQGRHQAPPPPVPAEPRGQTAAPALMPANDMQRAMARWEADVRQAVQDAAIYPLAARLQHRDGRAQVRFDYDRGSVELAAIAQTSHMGALDHAALAAVSHAAIPRPPAGLGAQKYTMLVWVDFSLQRAD